MNQICFFTIIFSDVAMSEPKIVAVFPGQISFDPRIGMQLLESSENVRKSVAISSKYANIDMIALLENPSNLHRPSLVQPIMTALSLGAYFDLHAHIPVDFLMGFADGETAAWGVSGSITPMDAIRYSLIKGRIIESESNKKPGAMIAVRGDDETFQRILEIGRQNGKLYLAGQYHSRECIFAGTPAAIQVVHQVFRGHVLPNTGALHSPLMSSAQQQLQRYVSNMVINDANVPIIGNVSGKLTTSSHELQQLILNQIVQPIQWASCVRAVPAKSIFVTLGFHQGLENLIRRNTNARVLPATSISAIKAIAKRSK